MLRKLSIFALAAIAALAMPMVAQAKTFYWISHGGPADPVWTYFLAGAKQWAADTDRPSRPRSTTATCRRSKKRFVRRSRPRPMPSSRPAPIPAAWWTSSRKQRPRISR